MKAQVGDHIIIEGPTAETTRRDGEIVALRHRDGTPPYDVCWSDTGRTSMVYPGPDSHIQHMRRKRK